MRPGTPTKEMPARVWRFSGHDGHGVARGCRKIGLHQVAHREARADGAQGGHDADIRIELAGRRIREIAGAIKEVVAVPIGHDAARGIPADPFQRRADGEAIGEGLDERHTRMMRGQSVEAHPLGIGSGRQRCSP